MKLLICLWFSLVLVLCAFSVFHPSSSSSETGESSGQEIKFFISSANAQDTQSVSVTPSPAETPSRRPTKSNSKSLTSSQTPSISLTPPPNGLVRICVSCGFLCSPSLFQSVCALLGGSYSTQNPDLICCTLLAGLAGLLPHDALVGVGVNSTSLNLPLHYAWNSTRTKCGSTYSPGLETMSNLIHDVERLREFCTCLHGSTSCVRTLSSSSSRKINEWKCDRP
jgi:hypothetical protein